MEIPRTLVDRVKEAITFGIRTTCVAVVGVPKSTREIAPAPPGVTIAQFNFGSTAIEGANPVLTGRVFVRGIAEQLLGMFGLEPPRMHTRVGGVVDRSRTVAIFVDE